MRIGFDVSQTGRSKAGCGYFADSLIRSLAEIDSQSEYILYPTFGDAFWDPEWSRGGCQIDRPNFRRGLAHKSLEAAQQFWRNPPPNLEANLGHPDIVHANNFYCPTALVNARLVYTLHDMHFLEHPEWTTEDNRLGCFAGVFDASLYADAIIAVSEHTRRHFLETFPHYQADRVVVIYEGSRFSARSDLIRPAAVPSLQPNGFWLNVGTIEPRKNHRRLIAAYARLKAHLGRTFPLVLVGQPGWLMEDLEQLVNTLGLRHDLMQLGYVDDATLRWLYEHCFALIYPSLFEGFGLPVLEAMTLGAPVIASSVSSLPEIVGTAGVLVDPFSEEAIFKAMLKLCVGEFDREALRDMARQRARSFSWETAARAVLELYDQVASRPARVE